MHYLLIKIQLLWTKHTKWLDRNPVKVPVSKRLIAYAIDWAVGGIISGFPAVLFYGGITGRSDMFSDLYVFPSLDFAHALSLSTKRNSRFCIGEWFSFIFYNQ